MYLSYGCHFDLLFMMLRGHEYRVSRLLIATNVSALSSKNGLSLPFITVLRSYSPVLLGLECHIVFHLTTLLHDFVGSEI